MLSRIAVSSKSVIHTCKFNSRLNQCLYFSSIQSPQSKLSEKFWTLPNAITCTRIAASPLLAIAIMHDMKVVALAGCAAGAISDWADGFIAKNFNLKSVWGGILDPLADKVFVGCIAGGLVYKNLFPVELLAVIVGRDVFLICSGLVLRALEKNEHSDFFDTTAESATFEITPTTFSKINTGIQFMLLSSTLSCFSFGYPTLSTLEPLWYLTAFTTIGSGLQYFDGSGMRVRSVEEKRAQRFTW
mmetsp:Transcript_4031/g.6246  ORF Transcript_4031/g.6246 Transcript_4031/m.6246 type:complete len:244 (-) Transcript_4031:173-904(-)